ncbi:hypothetical protein BGZ63DRAFT_358175 [Mariannaea sp. PMI_226]|nr:hypothetical protein BGZ63DRAFT_358175 [Mariannaea sp. PMI_226]
MLASATAPFPPAHRLSESLDKLGSTLPGYPNVSLSDAQNLWDFLDAEFWSADLDRIADKLWLMSMERSGNISPLHRQRVKRRTIVVTEDPKLHLIWIYDKIFIKPLPRYILSHGFWRDYLHVPADGEERQPRIRMAALGYIRTYCYLIRHESDFRIAQDPSLCLIPAEVTWEQFCQFTSDCEGITDRDVAPRYRFGEIRLTRLNFYAPFLLKRAYFQRVEYQYGSYFAQFYAPVLFIIGVLSIILNGIQITVAVKQTSFVDSDTFFIVAFGVSILVILIFSSLLLIFSFLIIYKFGREWHYAISNHFWKVKNN